MRSDILAYRDIQLLFCRYGLIGSVISLKKSDDGANVCRQILEKSGLKEWQVGKTKVFIIIVVLE